MVSLSARPHANSDALWRRVEGLSDATAEFIEKQLRMEDRDVYPGDKAQLQELQADFLARMKRAYLRPNALSDEQRQQVSLVNVGGRSDQVGSGQVGSQALTA